MKSVIFTAIVASALLAEVAHAQDAAPASIMVTEVSRQDIVDLVEANDRTVTNQGEEVRPFVEVETGQGFRYALQGNACDEGVCGGLKFIWRAQTTPPPLAFINDVNAEVLPLKVWADSNGVSVERYLILDPGLSVDSIVYEMGVFESLVPLAVQLLQERTQQNNAQPGQQGEPQR